jgi:hypothetical protein
MGAMKLASLVPEDNLLVPHIVSPQTTRSSQLSGLARLAAGGGASLRISHDFCGLERLKQLRNFDALVSRDALQNQH